MSSSKTPPKKYYFKKILISIVLGFTVFFSSGSVALFSFPQPAQAQWGIVADVPRIVEWVKKGFSWLIDKGLKFAYYEAGDYFLKKLAYDSAVALSSGDKGQKEKFFRTNWKDYIKDTAEQAGAMFIDNLGTEILGQSLCKPIDPLFSAKLTLNLGKTMKPGAPSCTFDKMIKNLQNTEILGGTGFTFDRLGNVFNALDKGDKIKFSQDYFGSSNYLSAFVELKSMSKDAIQKEMEAKKKEREKANPAMATKELISGNISTPGELIDESIKKTMGETAMNVMNKDPLLSSAKLFLSTFAQNYLQRLIREGLFPSKKGSGGSSSVGVTAPVPGGGAMAAKAHFADFMEPNIKSGGSFSPVSVMLACPSNTKMRSWNHCIIDQSFAEAINQMMTIGEAVEGSGDSSPPVLKDKIFGFKSDGTEPTPLEGISYKSMVVLRKYRVIPVTWELAALYIKEINTSSNKQYRLEEIMKDYDAVDSPFYHLVDPNWVLKAPDHSCQAEGAGEQELDRRTVKVDSGERDENGNVIFELDTIVNRLDDYCADEVSCIQEDAKGKCLQMGYCTKERSTWHFKGDACKSQFATCETLKNKQGSNSYLTNTLTNCSPGDVGCSWYSMYKINNSEGEFEWAEDVYNQAGESAGVDGIITFGDVYNRVDWGNISYTRFFDNEVKECKAKFDGCNTFFSLSSFNNPPAGYDATTGSIYHYVQDNPDQSYGEWAKVTKLYLKKPPVYLNCPADLELIPDPECKYFAQKCTAEEVGCEFYTPMNGDPPVPAVIQENDMCSSECSGYDQYLQLATGMELSFDVNHLDTVVQLIPDTADSCQASEVGCEEFTNLDEADKGGEAIEHYSFLRNCILPDDPDAQVFYTWEGSDTAGYQLKTWMLEAPGGSPSGSGCSADTDEFNCRTFIDSDGATFEMDITTVVFATDDCHPYRRSLDGATTYGIASLSNSCRTQAVGCHEYRGNNGNVVNIISQDDFENMGIEGDSVSIWSDATISSESVYVGGHSIQKPGGNMDRDMDGLLEQGKSYVISFWARSDTGGAMTFTFDNTDTPGSASASSEAVNREWNYYRAGPIYIDYEISDDGHDLLSVTGPSGYLDNIIVREVTDSYYLIKDSWNTPEVCDMYGGQLGCEAYMDMSNSHVNLLSFSSLCSDAKVGCMALIDTQNTDNPYREIYDPGHGEFYDEAEMPYGPNETDNIMINNDQLVYLVNNKENRCESGMVGCRLAGRAILDRQSGIDRFRHEVEDFSDVFILDNPDNYKKSVCERDSLFCEGYSNKQTGFPECYIDPGSRVCEYKVVTDESGWYIKGTEDACPPIPSQHNKVCSNDFDLNCLTNAECSDNGICIDSWNIQPIHNNSEYYEEWVGLCPQAQSGCQQYIDPEGVKYCTNDQNLKCKEDVNCTMGGNTSLRNNGLCKPHLTNSSYYYFDQKVDKGSCTVVDREAGCLLFDQVDAFNIYSTAASFDGAAPVSDNNTNDADVILKVRKDRVCDEWLYCTASIVAYDDKNNREDRCFSVGACNRLDASGRCNSFPRPLLENGDSGDVIEIVGNQVYRASDYPDNQYTVDDLAIMTGMTKAGMEWSGGYPTGDGVIPGYYPFGSMRQRGGVFEDLVNPSFEKTGTSTVGLFYIDILDTPENPDDDAGWEYYEAQAGGSIVDEGVSFPGVDGDVAAWLYVHPEGDVAVDSSNVKLTQHIDLDPGEYVINGYLKYSGVSGETISGVTRPRVNVEIWENNDADELGNLSGGFVGTSDGWEPFALTFENTVSDVSIRLTLWQVDEGDAYFDDIQIRPVLVASESGVEPEYIRQSCRLYPNADSLDCNYTKDGTKFTGWPGYCVEPDPNNSRYCVNWWPIDVPAGSSDLLGTVENPLYYDDLASVYYCTVTQDVSTVTALRSVTPALSNAGIEFPRYVCLVPDNGCDKIARVAKPTPQFMDAWNSSPRDHRLVGYSRAEMFEGAGDVALANGEDYCLYSNDRDIESYVIGGGFSACISTIDDSCLNSIGEYFNKVEIYEWVTTVVDDCDGWGPEDCDAENDIANKDEGECTVYSNNLLRCEEHGTCDGSGEQMFYVPYGCQRLGNSESYYRNHGAFAGWFIDSSYGWGTVYNEENFSYVTASSTYEKISNRTYVCGGSDVDLCFSQREASTASPYNDYSTGCDQCGANGTNKRYIDWGCAGETYEILGEVWSANNTNPSAIFCTQVAQTAYDDGNNVHQVSYFNRMQSDDYTLSVNGITKTDPNDPFGSIGTPGGAVTSWQVIPVAGCKIENGDGSFTWHVIDEQHGTCGIGEERVPVVSGIHAGIPYASASDLTSGPYGKVYNYWTWDGDNYGNQTSNPEGDWDRTPHLLSPNGRLPIIGNILLNDSENQIVLNSGGLVTLKFTSDVVPHQKPLRKYEINWGDGGMPTVYSGSFDHRPYSTDPHIIEKRYEYYESEADVQNSCSECEGGACKRHRITIDLWDNWGHESEESTQPNVGFSRETTQEVIVCQ